MPCEHSFFVYCPSQSPPSISIECLLSSLTTDFIFITLVSSSAANVLISKRLLLLVYYFIDLPSRHVASRVAHQKKIFWFERAVVVRFLFLPFFRSVHSFHILFFSLSLNSCWNGATNCNSMSIWFSAIWNVIPLRIIRFIDGYG